ncbi:hypothetical protein [Streptococcus suis]|uniref:hypothetical protein n=1 Tax=Streptococcus suis TaxID=1307 RepID=UPI0007696132|nr:hypothetical protein [Streptococcus suis]CYV33036.1 two-component sensor histidine kinase [Streptococcus suis]CYV52558.1 two-component sensor histidine kinase [Streptococcus suis]
MINFPDIPRFYTALTESLACLLVCSSLVLSEKWSRKQFRILLIFLIQILLQLAAGKLPLLFWTVGMGINIAWMLVSIRFLGVIHKRTSFYLTAKAFIIAELVASITWHLYCLTIYHQPVDNLWTQGLFLLIISLLSYWLIYLQDKKVRLEELDKFIEQRDVTVAVFTTLSIFVLSNIGFILSGTRQFQDSTSIFILRTTVNLSGLLLLFTQESQQYDRYLRQELTSINNIFQLQYKQYQAYRENSEILDRKVHDLKHQLTIIQQESDKTKKEQYLEEMSEVIQTLDAKIETGNPVLDTILSQKITTVCKMESTLPVLFRENPSILWM